MMAQSARCKINDGMHIFLGHRKQYGDQLFMMEPDMWMTMKCPG
jgi:hypothetical protein